MSIIFLRTDKWWSARAQVLVPEILELTPWAVEWWWGNANLIFPSRGLRWKFFHVILGLHVTSSFSKIQNLRANNLH